VLEFKTAGGEVLALSVPASETLVLKHFQAWSIGDLIRCGGLVPFCQSR
jgi:hypothetical protein